MLTNIERRFLRHWEEQRTGGKTSYLFQYTLVGTFLGTLLSSIFLLLFFNIYYASPAFWMVPSSAFICSIAFSAGSWYSNEKKWKQIIKREMKAEEK